MHKTLTFPSAVSPLYYRRRALPGYPDETINCDVGSFPVSRTEPTARQRARSSIFSRRSLARLLQFLPVLRCFKGANPSRPFTDTRLSRGLVCDLVRGGVGAGEGVGMNRKVWVKRIKPWGDTWGFS